MKALTIFLFCFVAFGKDKGPVAPKPLTDAQKIEYLRLHSKAADARNAVTDLEAQAKSLIEQRKKLAEESATAEAKRIAELRKESGAPETCGFNDLQEWVMVKDGAVVPCEIPAKPAK